MQTWTPGYTPAYSAPPEDARSYICTGKAMFLAILKLLEGLVGLGLIAVLTIALADAGQYALRAFFDAAGVIWAVLVYSMLALMTADGLGGFFLRVARRGATPVQLTHVFRAIFAMFRFVLWCAVLAILVWFLIVCLSNSYGRWALGQVPFGTWAVLITVVVLEFLTRLTDFGYHRGIAQIAAHARRELAQKRNLRPGFWSRLPGKCVRIIVYYGIWIALILVVYIAATNREFAGSLGEFLGGSGANALFGNGTPPAGIEDAYRFSQDMANFTDSMRRLGEALTGAVNGMGLDKLAGLLGVMLNELPWDLFSDVDLSGLTVGGATLALMLVPMAWRILKAALLMGCARDFNRHHA